MPRLPVLEGVTRAWDNNARVLGNISGVTDLELWLNEILEPERK